ncbi:MAG: hypothetical protein CFE39_03520 [Comamonadaceae bacterium PBBC2]|nr:MAG: hypothetical protein CFE39_03520 [Comamonadaceae bacterium PBBC2]
MTQRHTAQAIGTRSLVWLLVLAVVLMGLSVARQQALGSWHLHADVGLRGSPTALAMPHSTSTSTFSAVASGLASHWLSRWQQQQVFGHGQLRVGQSAGPTLWAASAKPAPSHDHDHDHDHDTLERHHHALGDQRANQSAIALDGAAEAADAGSVGATLLLPQFASPSQGKPLAGMAAMAARNGPWPVQGAVRFASRKVVPLLRPPAFSHASRAA